MVAQGISADLIATVEGFTREECDELAVDSQDRAAKASVKEGRFERALVPIYHDDGTLALDHDEHPRPGTTVDEPGRPRAASFDGMGATSPRDSTTGPSTRRPASAYPELDDIRHVHHAGNSSGVVDGASAVLRGVVRSTPGPTA